MDSSDKLAAGFGTLIFLFFVLVFLGSAWNGALRYDCKIAAMQTRLYDSAHINQICEK